MHGSVEINFAVCWVVNRILSEVTINFENIYFFAVFFLCKLRMEEIRTENIIKDIILMIFMF